MRKHFIFTLMLFTFGLTACQSESEEGSNTTNVGSSNECDRQCLESYVDQYLVALAAHDTSLAPFSDTVKHTENAKELPFSGATEGLWANAEYVEDYKFYIADLEAGQVAYIGFVQEAGAETASLLSMRLRVEHEQITEVESVVIRTVRENNKWAFTTPPVEFSQALTSEERVSREELVKISSLYFDGIEQFNSGLVPWHEECYRLENGMWTAGAKLPAEIAANMPVQASAPAGTDSGAFGLFDKQACPVGFDSGGFAVIDNITPRRTAVVDVERGVTWGIYMFNHKGVETITMPDGSTAPAPYFGGQPNSMPMSELFKIKGGEIRDIMAIGVVNEYLSGSGWD